MYNQICLEESERCSKILDIYFETLTNCLNGRVIVAKELSDCKVDPKKLIRNQSKKNQKVYKAWRIGQEGVQHGEPEFLKEIIESVQEIVIWRDCG